MLESQALEMLQTGANIQSLISCIPDVFFVIMCVRCMFIYARVSQEVGN